MIPGHVVDKDRKVVALCGDGGFLMNSQELEVDGPALVAIPIDYRENLRLTERLGALAGMA